MHTIRMKRLASSAARAAEYSVGLCGEIVEFQYGIAVVDDDELAKKVKNDHGQTYTVERMASEPSDADIEAAPDADPVLPPAAKPTPVVSDDALEAVRRHRSAARIINVVLADIDERDPSVLYTLFLGLRSENKALKMPKKKLKAAIAEALEQEASEG